MVTIALILALMGPAQADDGIGLGGYGTTSGVDFVTPLAGYWKTDGSSSPSTGAWTLGNFNLTVDTSTLFLNAATNRVGINTLSPASDLDVGGLAGFTLTPAAAGTNPFIWFNDNGGSLEAFIAIVRSGVGALCNASAVDDVCFRAARGNILFSSDNGSTNILKLASSGNQAIWKSDLEIVEQAAPGVVAGDSVVYADSTAHALELSNNGDAFAPVARSISTLTSADFTTTSASLSDVTGLSFTLPVGTWKCVTEAALADSTAAEGAIYQLTFGGTSTTGTGVGTLTADTGVISSTGLAAGSAVSGAAATFAAGAARVEITYVVTVAGTLKVRASQNTHASGTLTVYKGASLLCQRM